MMLMNMNMNMKEECGEELLTLGLSINSGWSPPDVSKKRKRPPKEHEPPTYHLFLRTGHDAAHEADNLHTLLRTRDQMLSRQDPKRRRGGSGSSSSSSGGAEVDGKGLEPIRSLLMAATAVDSDNIASAVDSLTELYRSVSPTGDPVQRVAAYFADGLAARLLRRRSSPLNYGRILARPTAEEELSAFAQLYQASPYYQFAHFTANQAIVEAFDNEEEAGINGRTSGQLHVVDLDVSYGFQWPSLIQSLSDKATSTAKPISLRITGLGESLDRLKETGERLTNFARGCCNLHFKFEAVLRTSGGGCNFKIDKSETLVVNSVLYLQSLSNSADVTATLRDIHSLNPSVVVLVEKEGGIGTPRSFLSRFMESLHYFAAMFDSLDDCLPADSVERISIESNHLGREIKNVVVACGEEEEEEEEKKNSKCDKLESLKERMEKSRFEGVKLSSRSVSQAKLLLKIKSHCSETEHGSGGGGFRVFWRDDDRGLSLGWQDRHLITASAWRCARLTSGEIVQSQQGRNQKFEL